MCSHLIFETDLLNQAYSLGERGYLLCQFDGLPLRLRGVHLSAMRHHVTGGILLIG